MMYKKLYDTYFIFSKKWMTNPSFLNTICFKFISFITKFYLNKIFIHTLSKKLKYFTNLPSTENEEIIVSLTTFPARIEQVEITIKTLFCQNILPNRIILWLAQEQFPKGIENLPDGLKSLQKHGLEIRFCEDFKSHKKYFYTMKENPDSIVITVDDDVFYPIDTIKNLIELHKLYPQDVICNSAVEINDDFFLPPSKWKTPHFNHINSKYAKCRILGISGILYPPHCLNELVFDVKLRNELCPWADDLWLTIMTYLNGRNIVRYEFRSNPLDVEGTQKFNLSRGSDMGIEVTHGLTNDDQWLKLTSYFKNRLETIFKEKQK